MGRWSVESHIQMLTVAVVWYWEGSIQDEVIGQELEAEACKQ